MSTPILTQIHILTHIGLCNNLTSRMQIMDNFITELQKLPHHSLQVLLRINWQ